MIRFLSILSIIIVILSLVSCGFKKNIALPQIYMGYNASFIYAKAHKQMQNQKYFDSIASYKSLLSQYPFTPLSEKGMVDLIYVYYINDESNLSLNLAKQFIKMYPYSKFKGYIFYMIGVLNFEYGRGFLQNYAAYDMSDHDPTIYMNAYNNFAEALSFDLSGDYVHDAKRRMIYIYNMISKYYYNIAHFYFKRGAYNAAINRASQVIENYSQSNSTENSLILKIKAYKALGLDDQVEVNTKVLKLNYPNSKYI